MDSDQQVRLNFLEESVEYFEQMEQVLLGFEAADNKPQQIDIALRAAHSIKGSAGMMGFLVMARVAHRLEDFFKILRARQIHLDAELETWLLQGVDALKAIRQRLVEEEPVDQAWLNRQVEPIFAQLQERLGDVSSDDENRLLAKEEDVDLGLLIFTSGVEESLDKFNQEMAGLGDEALRQAVIATAAKLSNLGLMGEIDAFVALCASIQAEAAQVGVAQVPSLVDHAMQLWERSQALVQLGRLDNLPQQLNFQAEVGEGQAEPSQSQFAPEVTPEITSAAMPDMAQLAMSPMASAGEEISPIALTDLQKMQAEMERLTADPAALGLVEQGLVEAELEPLTGNDEQPQSDAASDRPDLNLKAPAVNPEVTLPWAELSQLQDAIAQIDPLELAALDSAEATPAATPGMQAADKAAIAPPPPATLPQATSPKATLPKRPTSPPPQRGATLRIAAEDLRQINSLFSSLILERNSISLRQRQLTGFAQLLQDRMQTLESFNLRLRQWYDRASMEGLVQRSSDLVAVSGAANLSRPGQSHFDSLEMDQYSDLHLMAQEQMETVVQLQEVTADIMLGLQEMGQATQKLNGTTRSLQNRITRTQMRPFVEVVARFPRVIRDLSVQYGKKVELSISGESTLFERVALEALTDPLNHLLRNCFDHGIEPEAERLAQGKPAQGQISIQASQQGNQAKITITDDGRGIDLDRIKGKLRQHGIAEDHIAQMTERDLLSLIFDAGFSTAEKVTELSGRGVGMDVVRSNIEKLKGDIQVETQMGQGSCFTITLPLSLSVFRIVLLEQRKTVFAVPVDAVTEMIICKPGTIVQPADAAPYVDWNGQPIPVVDLTDHVACQGDQQSVALAGNPSINHPLLVVVHEGDRPYAIPIDRYWNEQEVTLRPVVSPIPLPPGFMGATILEDGRVVPLVNLVQLVQVQRAQAVGGDAASTITALGQPRGNRQTASPYAPSPTLPDPADWLAPQEKQVILVVDDSVHVRRYLTLTLEKAGYEVEQAKDGQEGVDLLLGGLQVQAVLCDLEMPRLDGYGFLDEIRSQSQFTALPITMLTSRNSDKHRKLAMSLGASAYFSKPYNEQELLKALEELIQQAQAA